MLLLIGSCLCIVAKFGHLGQLVIFLILCVFKSCFMHRAAVMQFQSGFSHVSENCNFSTKVRILQRNFKCVVAVFDL